MSNYLFAVADCDGEITAVIVEESFFRQNGGIDDQHISKSCGGDMPDILGWDEVMESFFMPWNETMVASEAHDDLLKKGLTFDPNFADWADEDSDGDVYRPA